MGAADFIYLLQDVLMDQIDDGLDIVSIRGFQESMLLTNDEGLVIRMSSGEEFRVTVVRSA